MNSLRIIPLGGMGSVTKNMFVYEYGDEMLIVDCGIGFPESSMLGVDVLIPDVTYLRDRISQGAKIVGMCLSHGHDDHIAALPYVIPQLPDFEIYGSPLTAAFATARLTDFEISKTIQVVEGDQEIRLGSFAVRFVRMTHSVPHTTHLIINTPQGLIYHGSDFKLDLTPVDGVLPEFSKITQAGDKGVLCVLLDCLRVERSDWSPSEMRLANSFEREIVDCQGKFIVTLMSSNVHRIGLVANTAINHGRKLVFVGRSIEQNYEIASQLGVLNIPKASVVHKKHIEDYKDNQLCVIVAGSQGQPGSSLVRAIYGEHPILQVSKKDKVVFATEPIPGNEANVYEAIDELSRQGIDVAYSDVDKDLHVSGHGGAMEQQMMLALLKPQFVLPIGGTDRHRVVFSTLAKNMGYQADQVLLPKNGEVIELNGYRATIGETLQLKTMMVDGLGIGDVGNVVLSDRKTMAEEGMIVVIIPEHSGVYDPQGIQVVSRGFVFMKKADEIVRIIKEEVADILTEATDETELKKRIERRLTKRMDAVIGRTPLILPVIMSS